MGMVVVNWGRNNLALQNQFVLLLIDIVMGKYFRVKLTNEEVFHSFIPLSEANIVGFIWCKSAPLAGN